MFVHAVFFWLKPDLTAQQRAAFKQGLQSLTTITTVRNAHIGVPAPTNRPIIERSYSYALSVSFDDEGGHDYYQQVDIHDRFRQACSTFWSKVVIYDSITG
jgi:hypothetical protein